MGNGAKAQQKRDRKGDSGPKEAKSQLKSNSAAQTVKCKTCFQTFQSTTNRKLLTEHAANKHSKQFVDCFEAEDGVAK
ncbi:At2g23090 like protein [Boeremia exigua]|uniref:At2g23090 like protein n=1 Tax=Boeremia exigua TaxID=749465 RepID=UPI001E8DAB75|nr:At2g23090 like protein [Boeremia exigua]KAH6643612.1 At2g23090 like protein [Boeremia exigua]